MIGGDWNRESDIERQDSSETSTAKKRLLDILSDIETTHPAKRTKTNERPP